MAKKYTNWYSNLSHQSHKCICKGDFLNVMKNRSRPSFITVDTFVYFKYNEEQYNDKKRGTIIKIVVNEKETEHDTDNYYKNNKHKYEMNEKSNETRRKTQGG